MRDTGSAILIFRAKESKNGTPHSCYFRDEQGAEGEVRGCGGAFGSDGGGIPGTADGELRIEAGRDLKQQ